MLRHRYAGRRVPRWLWGVCKQQSQTIVDIRGRSDTDNSSMSGVQSCSRTMTVLHQRSLTYEQTPPPFSFPVVCLSRSSRAGHPNPLMNVPRSPTFLSSHVSVKTMRQGSLYSLKRVALARNSSILRPFRDRTLAKIMDGKGGLCFIFRSLCRTPPFLPRLRNGWVLFLVMPVAHHPSFLVYAMVWCCFSSSQAESQC